MMNIAIVEDDAEDRQRLIRCLQDALRARNIACQIDCFDSGESFLFSYRSDYDMVFLDIMLGEGIDGQHVAQKLREIDKTVPLIFVTNLVQMAVHGYEVDALDFILKPVQPYSFGLKLDRILSRVDNVLNTSILVHTEEKSVKLRVQLINYLLVQGHYIEFHSREGIYTQYMTLSAAEKQLNDPCFYRCNRSCLVNLRRVSSVDSSHCIVDGQELPIARTQRHDFLRAFAEYLNGHLQKQENHHAD